MREMLRRALPVAALTSVMSVGVALGMAGAANAAPTHPAPLRIVNLGDSYASGPGIPGQVNALCARSDHNYGRLAANALGAELDDQTCSGAVTKDVLDKQIDALNPRTNVVFVSIGGNDADFVHMAVSCIERGVNLTLPSCQEAEASRAQTTLVAEKQKVAATYKIIRARAPKARIFGIGYGDLLGNAPCMELPLRAGDVPWMQKELTQLNEQTKKAVEQVGGTYIDSARLTRGHGACSADPWFQGAISTPAGEALHPNVNYMIAIAHQLVADIRKPHGSPSAPATSFPVTKPTR